MADADALHIGENSPEQVAFKLLYEIANVEKTDRKYRRSRVVREPSIWRRAAANASLIATSTCTWLRSSEGWWLITMFSWVGIVTQMLIR